MHSRRMHTARAGRAKARHAMEWVESVAFAALLVVLTFTFLFRIVVVDGISMEPTLHDRDVVISSGLFYQPEAGDVVVITPGSELSVSVVKRVIATEGQTVDIDFGRGVVSVDGRELDEPYLAEATHRFYDIPFPQEVPEGCVFVMGDNRNHSMDSRDSAVGMVDARRVLGRVWFRLLPPRSAGRIE